MPRPRKTAPPAAARPAFDPAALDALLGERRTAGELEDLFRQMKGALMERMLAGERTAHLGYGPGAPKPEGQPNTRNGTTPKTVLTDDGALPLAVPRDRDGSFTPQLVPKGVRRLPRFDQNVLSLYARGMSVREIREHLEQRYQVEVAPAVISAVTDEVLDEVTAWQQRPLDRVYPVVIFDALRVKIRDEGTVRNKAVSLALGVTTAGTKDVLGRWVEQTEGAKFWHRVMTELRARGVTDVLVALVAGLTGFPDAIHAVFPQAQVHTCVGCPDGCIWCGRASPTSRTRTASAWPARCGPSTARPRWRRPRRRCTGSRRAPTASATPRSPPSGGARGRT